MKVGYIRPIALGVFYNNDQILVFEGHDPHKGQTFYRLLGGGIEFSEYGHQTIQREFREELGEEVAEISYLGTLENIFTYNAHPGHEIALIYKGKFTNPAVYQQAEMTGQEDDGSTFRVLWKELDYFRSGQAPLYPNGLLELLDGITRG